MNKLISKHLRELADRFDAGTSEITEEQGLTILSLATRQRMSKEQACSYLNMPINTFNMYVSKGVIPKGHKERGFKELTWYRDELDKVTYKYKSSLTI